MTGKTNRPLSYKVPDWLIQSNLAWCVASDYRAQDATVAKSVISQPHASVWTMNEYLNNPYRPFAQHWLSLHPIASILATVYVYVIFNRNEAFIRTELEGLAVHFHQACGK